MFTAFSSLKTRGEMDREWTLLILIRNETIHYLI